MERERGREGGRKGGGRGGREREGSKGGTEHRIEGRRERVYGKKRRRDVELTHMENYVHSTLAIESRHGEQTLTYTIHRGQLQ